MPAPAQARPQTQITPNTIVARFHPDRPARSPKNITFPILEGIGRRQFSESVGFLPVNEQVAAYLKTVHSDGETTARGGRGPMLFQICTAAEAQRILVSEQKQALIEASGLKQAINFGLGGQWTADDFSNMGTTPPPGLTPDAKSPADGATPGAGDTKPAAARVGRRRAK